MSLRKAVECVKKHKKFLISAHTNLEGDAVGSELAFQMLLKKLGKDGVIINEDDIPYGYDFLPGAQKLKKFHRKVKGIRFDCFAVLDCSDLKRTGEVYTLNENHKPVLNIDHHISNENFADVNWVDPKASSACEMVYRLYKKLRVPLDREAATCLYVGILTDTGSFRYTNTTSQTHKIVSELLKFNLDIPAIYKNAYENIPYQDMKFLSTVLPGIRREAGGRIAWVEIPQKMYKNRKLSFDLTDHVLTFARAIKDVEVVALFKENLGVKDEIRVNFRSQGSVDVNRIAAYFGGGGHKTASGATVHGKIQQVRKKVLAKIKESLR